MCVKRAGTAVHWAHYHVCQKGWNSSDGSALGSLSCVIHHPGLGPPQSHLINGISQLELTYVLIPFPSVLDESIN